MHEPVVGRAAELAALSEFLSDPGVLMLTGGPGIGKTTLWQAGIDAARERGLRVLTARPTGAEAQLSLAALIDLCDGLDIDGLPAPQRSALEVALLRARRAGAPPEPHAIAVGFLNLLRGLAEHEPLLVAIDDLQWLDAASAEVLAFAARRLEGERVAFLLAKRPGRSSALEQAFGRRKLQRLHVGPLSFGAVRMLLAERLGLTLPRHLLRRIADSTLGNPLFALEVGRMVIERGLPELGDDLPVPEAVEDMLGTRVAGLPDATRRLLLAVALSGELRPGELEALAGPAAVDDAVDAGLLLVDSGRVRASHPLLAAAAKKQSRVRERRELHLALAGTVADAELCALHLALATPRPDPVLAADAAAAAALASARGARLEAVQLAEHALRLTPPGSNMRSERLLALAGYLETAGQVQRITELLLPELESFAPGAMRARAWLLLAEGGHVRTLDELLRHFDLALAECELELRAGEWDAASRLLDEWAESAERELLVPPLYEKSRAGLAAGRGLPDETASWAAKTIATGEATGSIWEPLEARLALGTMALLTHEPAQAVEVLRAIWEHTQREGIDDPGVLPVAPELVEALVAVGELDEARAVVDRLRELSEQQEHPWGLATAKRCGAVVRLASGGYDKAEASVLADAAAEYGELGLRFDRARTLLSLGRGMRRLKQWRDARESLEQAVAAFDELGSPGWADEARSQLARVGGRRPGQAGGLTPSEQRVAELAVEGHSNKEIARTLFVTVHTVEVHLSRAYSKLGVRSRTQLAGRLAARAKD